MTRHTSAYVELIRTLTPEQLALLDQVEQDIRADERREGGPCCAETYEHGRQLAASLASEHDRK